MKLKKNIALSDTGFVFDPSTGDSFTVNPIGLDIIRQMKEGKPAEAIRRFLADTYEADEATIERDLADFTNMLGKWKLTGDHDQA